MTKYSIYFKEKALFLGNKRAFKKIKVGDLIKMKLITSPNDKKSKHKVAFEVIAIYQNWVVVKFIDSKEIIERYVKYGK